MSNNTPDWMDNTKDLAKGALGLSKAIVNTINHVQTNGFPARRIQRKRTKGWRKPDNAIIITRPGKFGNPFPVKKFGRRKSIELFDLWFNDGWHDDMIGYVANTIDPKKRESMLNELRDKVLCCWCKTDERCHGDVYIQALAEEMGR